MKKQGEFIVGRRVLDDNVQYHWQEIDLSNFKVERPVVLILGGSTVENNRFANGYAKLVQNLLGSFAEDVDVLSVNYNGGTKDNKSQQNCDDLVEKLFVPLISKDGQKLDIKTACKNVRKITIFGHCVGDDWAREIFSSLATRMKKFKYTEEEQSLIFSQIFEILYGIWSRVPYQFPDVPVFNVLSPEDEMWATTDYFWRMILDKSDEIEISSKDKDKLLEMAKNAKENKFHFERFYDNNQRCFVVRDGNRLGVACSGLQKDSYDDHSIDVIARNKDWSKLDGASDAGDYVSRCIACALCNSVANSLLNQKIERFVPFALEVKNLAKNLTKICKRQSN